MDQSKITVSMITDHNKRPLIGTASTPVRLAVKAWLLFLTLTLLPAQVKSHQYTIHLSPSGTAPFAIVENNGGEVSYRGIMYDFLDAFQEANPEFTRNTILLPRVRTNRKMARGEDIDIQLSSPSFVSPDILQHYKFTDTFLTSEDKLVTLKKKSFSYRTSQDLHGKTIGTIRGYSYALLNSLIDSGLINDVRVDSHEQALGMLHKGRIDAYIGNIHVAPVYIKQKGLDVTDFNFSDVSLYEFDLAFAVNKNLPVLYEKLNQFIKLSISDGSLDAIVDSYIE